MPFPSTAIWLELPPAAGLLLARLKYGGQGGKDVVRAIALRQTPEASASIHAELAFVWEAWLDENVGRLYWDVSRIDSNRTAYSLILYDSRKAMFFKSRFL
jgi:hypothetical protein